MADDAFILGHRNSEWTGLGPTLEEDIAFSSMAQDKVGHALALYKILHEEFGEKDPDKIAYERAEKDFKCCHLVEIYSQDYAFALARHFFFDHADYLRYDALSSSSLQSIAQLSRKIKGELKYHIMHADVWLKKLGAGNEESRARMQSALNEAFPEGLGIFEPGNFEEELKTKNIFPGEATLKATWLSIITPLVSSAGFSLPDISDPNAGFGGRKGFHSDHLSPLLKEMREVYILEPNAEW